MKLGPGAGVAVLHSPSGPSRSDFAAAVAAAICSATAAGSAFCAWPAEMPDKSVMAATTPVDARPKAIFMVPPNECLFFRHGRAEAPTGPREARPDDRLRASSR